MLQKLVLVILRSLFLYDYIWARRGSIFLGLFFTVAVFASIESLKASIIALLLLSLAYWIAGMVRVESYAAIIALIPAAWMSATQAVIDYFQSSIDPLGEIAIGIRALTASLATLYLLHFYNPLELAYLLRRIGGCRASYIPLLLPKIISELLREAVEALHAHSLKKTPAWKTLSILLYNSQEMMPKHAEGLAQRIDTCNPRPLYSLKAIILQAGLIVALLLADIFTP